MVIGMHESVKDLPINERIRLVEELWDSIASDQGALPLTEAQKAELDVRLRAYEVDGEQGQPSTDVVANIRRRL